MTKKISRRRVLHSSAASVAALSLDQVVACPRTLCLGARNSKSDGKILVVVEMAGGNDGLNTVVPFNDDAYRKARPNLRIEKSSCLAINDDRGFHPALTGFASLLEQGKLSILHGIGYPDPNRSHFESMDIWHTCHRKDEPRPDGWIGRALQASRRESNDPPAIHLGSEQQPFALMSRELRVPSIQSLQQFQLRKNGSVDLSETIRELSAETTSDENELLGFIQSSTSSAIMTSERMEQTRKQKPSQSTYPKSNLGQKLQTVSQLIASDLETRVYYVRIDGFDTHANQPDAHTALLREVGDAVNAFVADISGQGNGDRVLVMCFSEFGRRVAENASDGTDHGTAAPVFFAGGRVRAGEVGDYPSLTDLEEGDLKHHTDFRSVYATVLQQWLECSSDSILDGSFPMLPFLDVG
ncbi:DUF1501 domain-containing protein [Rhodopirellula sp. MGV]|uniref:DUF1501 domain-containing protein n=1 Tax=Rhodopirellula sp. MGV TaxID=2023130 RepID=UPI000B96A6C7|nr:DUF1501 domain-containing protein [Rhodopirellula sp. MGV]OYP31712.1 hypothetical protein CGZ80_20675 [Rhodopirellula sp. MGV]PNY34012.1 DUF1501 domain-containing protein [Rhodopirellula baltica]